MFMYMTSVQSSSVEQRKSVSAAAGRPPKCAGSFAPKLNTPITANR